MSEVGGSRARAGERYEIGAVSRALAILDLIVQNGGASLVEAAAAARVAKSTAYRLLTTLERARLVERRPEGGYVPGAVALRWAGRLIARLELRDLALPYLRQLRDVTGETVNLATLHEAGMAYVEILQSPAAFRMADTPGDSVPMHAAALGKAVGASLDPSRLAVMLGPEPYPALTPHTSTTWRQLSGELEQVRHRGYALDLQQVDLGASCVAVALPRGGTPVGAISVAGPSVRVTEDRLESIGRLLIEAATEISELLGPDLRASRPSA
jgi:IclR family acetate operon transcriptional repressor